MTSSHAYHQELDGYHEDQVLHDGCSECEHRAKHLDVALAVMDPERFDKAWKRAAAVYGNPGEGDYHLAKAEEPVLQALYGVQVQLQRVGLKLGHLPRDIKEYGRTEREFLLTGGPFGA